LGTRLQQLWHLSLRRTPGGSEPGPAKIVSYATNLLAEVNIFYERQKLTFSLNALVAYKKYKCVISERSAVLFAWFAVKESALKKGATH